MSYYEKAKTLFRMIEEGKLLDALDKYYHKDVLIIADDIKASSTALLIVE